MSPVDEIFSRFREGGDALYIGEPVTVSEHMLQSASFATRDNAPPELVAAALLHDYGHLITDLPEDSAERGVDTRHEELGFAFLEEWFPVEVTEPIRLHVAAKRYLVAVDPMYSGELSPASLLSLELQGGPMSEEEVEAFAAGPHAEAACRLRRWDDAGKEPGMSVPPLESYRELLESLLQ
jgi:[1-hydroxy-2-(trimethylamino)ethyl]phosphonate dioxygenase